MFQLALCWGSPQGKQEHGNKAVCSWVLAGRQAANPAGGDPCLQMVLCKHWAEYPHCFSNHLNGMPSPRAAILQVPRQSCPVPEPGQCCAPRGFANLCFTSLEVVGCWQCISQLQESTARQSLRSRDTSCPGDGPCHPPVKPSTHGSHTELGQQHSPGTKCC